MNMVTLNGHEQEQVQNRWNWFKPARRQEMYFRHQGILERLFDRLGLTGTCMSCGVVMPAGQFTHRYPCPQCGRVEVATPYGS